MLSHIDRVRHKTDAPEVNERKPSLENTKKRKDEEQGGQNRFNEKQKQKRGKGATKNNIEGATRKSIFHDNPKDYGSPFGISAGEEAEDERKDKPEMDKTVEAGCG